MFYLSNLVEILSSITFNKFMFEQLSADKLRLRSRWYINKTLSHDRNKSTDKEDLFSFNRIRFLFSCKLFLFYLHEKKNQSLN
jgi:hypothetical protein